MNLDEKNNVEFSFGATKGNPKNMISIYDSGSKFYIPVDVLVFLLTFAYTMAFVVIIAIGVKLFNYIVK